MKKYFTGIMLLAMAAAMTAQTLEISNVKKMTGRGIGEIAKGDEMIGYYAFYELEKEDRKTSTYRIDIADNNVNKATSFDITRDSKSSLLEVVFNGTNFMLVFYTKDLLEYVIYDTKGKQTGKYEMAQPSSYEKMRIQQQLANPEVENVTTFSLGQKGFVKQTTVDNKKIGYRLTGIGNEGKEIWTFALPHDSELLEFGDVIDANENYITLYVVRKKTMMTRKTDNFIIVVDVTDGKKVFEYALKANADADLSMLNCYIEKDRGTATIIGELYAPGEEPLKDQSAGLFIKELDMQGNVKSSHDYLWNKEVKKVKNAKMTEEQKESEKKSALYIHKVVRSKNGTLTLIGEQYKKAVSALGVLSKGLGAVAGGGSNTSAMEMVIMNMVVMQFDAAMVLTDYQIVDKKLSRINMPTGYGTVSPVILAAYIKAIGGFDYSYTTVDKATDKAIAVYTDFNRKEEDSKVKNDVMVGVISINNGTLAMSRVPFNSDASSFYIKAAKPGYIMVTEYFKKQKKVKTRLESLKS